MASTSDIDIDIENSVSGFDIRTGYPTADQARSALRTAVAILNSRGLVIASRWAAELLVSMPPEHHHPTPAPDASMVDAMNEAAGGGKGKRRAEEWVGGEDEEKTTDQYVMGKAYFDARDFERAALVLRGSTDAKERFLQLYASYMMIERKIVDMSGVVLGPRDKRNKIRPEHAQLLAMLKDTTDPFELYLKAMLQHRLTYRLAAIDTLVQSVNAFEYNWSAWKLLEKLIEGIDELRTILPRVPQTGFMSRFFLIHATLEAHNASDTMEKTLQTLAILFPNSLHLRGQRALIAYHLREFDACEALFDSIFSADPHRIEDVDTYSNILYVMEKKAKLTALAQRFSSGEGSGSERMRPEVCCLLGNYWSLRGEHERAVGEFRRAVKLDPGYLSAWTLMGHEYVEMKNTHAAIESYRRAIDCNSKDYRAWYGLGQTYEVLEMPFYALHYYQRSTCLRPYDARMWLALASIYEKLDRRPEAIKTTKRALLNAGGDDDTVLAKLAALLDAEGLPDEAVRYHRRLVDQVIQDEGGPSAKLARSYLYMAKYEITFRETTGGNLRAAKEFLITTIRMNVDERDEAREMLRQLEALL